jgi:hypothetical protein
LASGHILPFPLGYFSGIVARLAAQALAIPIASARQPRPIKAGIGICQVALA